jgi:FkbM family methyltransferase
MFCRIRGHYIWPAPLGTASIVVDAGAYRGEFSAQMAQRFGARCFLIEANPVLAAELNVPDAGAVIPAALTSFDGPILFQPRENLEAGSIVGQPSSRETSGTGETRPSADTTTAPGMPQVTVNAISLSTLMRDWNLDHIDLLKLDIEGAEFDLIESTPEDVLRRIGQLTVEFHDFLPQFSGRGLFEKARDRLTHLGFQCSVMSFSTHGDVLFLNRERHRLTSLQTLYARHVARYVESFKRRFLARP